MAEPPPESFEKTAATAITHTAYRINRICRINHNAALHNLQLQKDFHFGITKRFLRKIIDTNQNNMRQSRDVCAFLVYKKNFCLGFGVCPKGVQ